MVLSSASISSGNDSLGNIKAVTSRDNAAVKALRALAADPREIRRQKRTLLIGPHLVDVYVRRFGMPERVVVSATGQSSPEVRQIVEACCATEVLQVPDAVFRELSGGGTPVGILAAVPVPEFSTEAVRNSCVLLDAIQDAGNVGTILRTAAAAGICDVVLGVGCAGAWTPRVLRAGQGAHFSLRICEHADLRGFLENFPGTSVATVARGGQSLFEANVAGEIAWIFGNEGAGVNEELARAASLRITIPLAIETESLNVAAAAAVCLFEGVRQKYVCRGEV